MEPLQVRPAETADADFVRATLRDSWGGTAAAVHGELIDAATHPALIAWQRARPVGLLTYQAAPDDHTWEILTLGATTPCIGAGSALLTALRTRARARRVHRIGLVTTNDNTTALRFYQRRGFDLAALHRDAATAARTLKSAIPHTADGIPIRHELVLDLHLDPTSP